MAVYIFVSICLVCKVSIYFILKRNVNLVVDLIVVVSSRLTLYKPWYLDVHNSHTSILSFQNEKGTQIKQVSVIFLWFEWMFFLFHVPKWSMSWEWNCHKGLLLLQSAIERVLDLRIFFSFFYWCWFLKDELIHFCCRQVSMLKIVTHTIFYCKLTTHTPKYVINKQVFLPYLIKPWGKCQTYLSGTRLCLMADHFLSR